MAQSVIGALRVNLGLDSAQFSRGLTDAQKNLKRARAQFLAVTAVAAAAFGGLAAAARQGAAAIDANAKAARRIGASVGGFRALEMAASDAGVSLSGLANDVQTMNRELARAEIGEGNAADALARLGMAASDFAGLDADERIAVLADAVQKLGLDSGQTTLLLRDLGIRNREMALLVMGGGEAIRAARQDVQDYGLALSQVDTDRIEAANDNLAGLGDIATYVGDQLALKFVPAMGDLAKAMNESLREGGTLRKVLDGMIASLDAIAIAMGGLIVSFGARYVAAMIAATTSTGVFTTAVNIARAATIALGGPLGIIWGLIGAAGAAWLVFRDNGDTAKTTMEEVKVAQDALNVALGQFRSGVQGAGTDAIAYAKDLKTQARAALAAAEAELQLRRTRLAEFGEPGGVRGSATLRARQAAAAEAEAQLVAAQNALDNAGRTLQALSIEAATAGDAVGDVFGPSIESGALDLSVTIDGLNDQLIEIPETAGAGVKALKEIPEVVEDATNAISDLASRGVDGLANAFADFAMRGFRDFKSFARSIVDTFKSMLRDMIVMAARNKIMLSLGFGGSVAGSAASAATGSAVGSGIGGAIAGAGGLAGLGSAALGGAQFVASGFATGGLAGAGSAIGTALSGATLGIGGAAAALGAVAAPLLAVYAAVKFFSKTTKTLDEGIKVAVKGMEASAETFKTIQTSRFFGLSKKTSTSTKSDPDNPIIGAVTAMQVSAIEAARVLGVGAAAFENFSYDFKLSLKGLTEDQRIAKINEELGNMGDEFASLVPNVENLNQLLERANQISASIRALTDTQTLFATRQEAVFAASQAGSLSADVDTTQGLLRDLIRAVREGDVNNGRLTAQLVAIQQRQELAPT